MAQGDDGGWQGFERVIDCDSRNVTGSLTQTPRGWIIDMVTSGIGGALAGYLLIQFLTLLVYMNASVLKPKQPHVLLIQARPRHPRPRPPPHDSLAHTAPADDGRHDAVGVAPRLPWALHP